MSLSDPHQWGLQSDITPRFGARLVQEGNRVYYLADRASLTGVLRQSNCKTGSGFPAVYRSTGSNAVFRRAKSTAATSGDHSSYGVNLHS